MSRYGSFEVLEVLDLDQILALVERAAELRAKEWAHRQWCALYPDMVRGFLKFMSFEEYYERITGGTIDTRSNDEILAEVAKVREELGITNGTV